MIPARGGSKGLARKNLQLIAGKTLVDHAIDAAEGSRFLSSRIVVTSDDPEVLAIARDRGCDWIARPAELCTDTAGTIGAVQHVLDRLAAGDHELPDAICLLQPTNPLRIPEDIDAAIGKLHYYKCGSVITHAPAHSHPMRQIWGDTLEPLLGGYVSNAPRQRLRPVFDRDGSVYLTRTAWIKLGTFYAPDGRILLIPRHRHLDIETEHDLEVARFLFPKRYQQGGTTNAVQDDRS